MLLPNVSMQELFSEKFNIFPKRILLNLCDFRLIPKEIVCQQEATNGKKYVHYDWWGAYPLPMELFTKGKYDNRIVHSKIRVPIYVEVHN